MYKLNICIYDEKWKSEGDKSELFTSNTSIFDTCVWLERLDIPCSNSLPQLHKVQILYPLGTDNGQIPVGCGKGCWNF